jgi:hypothetical protein
MGIERCTYVMWTALRLGMGRGLSRFRYVAKGKIMIQAKEIQAKGEGNGYGACLSRSSSLKRGKGWP